MQKGFVLVTALILLFLLSMMAIAVLETGLSETKLQKNIKIQKNSFQEAEQGLNLGERKLISFKNKNLTVHVTPLAPEGYYAITASSGDITLQSTFLTGMGRQSWRQLA